MRLMGNQIVINAIKGYFVPNVDIAIARFLIDVSQLWEKSGIQNILYARVVPLPFQEEASLREIIDHFVRVASMEEPQISVVHVYNPSELTQLPQWGVSGILNALFVKLVEDHLQEQVILKLVVFLIVNFTIINNRVRFVLDVIVQLLVSASLLLIRNGIRNILFVPFVCAHSLEQHIPRFKEKLTAKIVTLTCSKNLLTNMLSGLFPSFLNKFKGLL